MSMRVLVVYNQKLDEWMLWKSVGKHTVLPALFHSIFFLQHPLNVATTEAAGTCFTLVHDSHSRLEDEGS